MKRLLLVGRCRPWILPCLAAFALLALCAPLGAVPSTEPTTAPSVTAAVTLAATPTPAAPTDPVPDRTGAYQSTPTSASTPGFTPVTETSSPKDMAAAINAVAGGQARNYFSV